MFWLSFGKVTMSLLQKKCLFWSVYSDGSREEGNDVVNIYNEKSALYHEGSNFVIVDSRCTKPDNH